MGKLTLEDLNKMRPDTIFAKGITIDCPSGVNMANTNKKIKWVAIRGTINDWAIYIVYINNPYSPQPTFEAVAQYGDKIHNRKIIKQLVPCTDEALKMYRD